MLDQTPMNVTEQTNREGIAVIDRVDRICHCIDIAKNVHGGDIVGVVAVRSCNVGLKKPARADLKSLDF